MSKTASIPDDVHDLIIDKQMELKKKYRIYVKISDIIAVIIRNNIHNVGKYLGLKDNEGSDTVEDDMQSTTDPESLNLNENMEINGYNAS